MLKNFSKKNERIFLRIHAQIHAYASKSGHAYVRNALQLSNSGRVYFNVRRTNIFQKREIDQSESTALCLFLS